ncbi:MAG TPA: 16S rRNA (uracil(1498)-N(3))-methyltransferase [Polyangia bacterium]|nr:16S rRNA (uracil(1498)-N(3))-methyltransferase [Polyangia bacterium]
MARLYVPAERLDASELEVAGPEHHYLCRVLRLRPGDPVVLFDGQGHERDAQLIRVGPRSATLRLSGRREVALPSGPALTLLVGLAKGDKMDFIVQKATELGVARIVPVLTERSVIRPGERTRVAARQARWNKIAREAARQCGRADVPAIAPVCPLGAALAAAPTGALRLLFWEQARAVKLRDLLPKAPPAQVVIAVGPEGGFSAAEAAAAQALGFVAVGLGSRTLRAETAALAALAVVGYALGMLE